MIEFSNIIGVTIPEGSVTKIERNGATIWQEKLQDMFAYVSLGDSIPAGHSIDSDWESNYGERSQYGVNGNTSTTIVPGAYPDLIAKELTKIYGADKVTAISFDRSGDKVSDLMTKLSHTNVVNTIKRANLVTICIGANDVLGPAMNNLGDYLNNGNTEQLKAEINANFSALENDANDNSYKKLLDRLYNINPNAKYVFTTIYNPYKYLYVEPSAGPDYHDGFIGPLMWTLDWLPAVKATLYDQYIKNLVNNVNGVSSLTEGFVTRLNNLIKNKVNSYGNPNFIVANTKAAFDAVPDRTVSASKHYNDIVNVEFTRGYTVNDVDWAQFWNGSDYEDLVNKLIYDVIMPDVDPHPERDGHELMKLSFLDALGWSSLDRYTISFDANKGSGTTVSQQVVGHNGLPAYAYVNSSSFNPPTESNFLNWNTKADGSGTSYTVGQLIKVTGNITLYAQWSSTFTITYWKDVAEMTLPLETVTNHTGPVEKTGIYKYDENGNLIKLAEVGGHFTNASNNSTGATTIGPIRIGTKIRVISGGKGPTEYVHGLINFNGQAKTGKGKDVTHEFELDSNVRIVYHWYYRADNPTGVFIESNRTNYWVCDITTNV